MAQNNTFRTKRRRLNQRRASDNASERISYQIFVDRRIPLHETLDSYHKRLLREPNGNEPGRN